MPLVRFATAVRAFGAAAAVHGHQQKGFVRFSAVFAGVLTAGNAFVQNVLPAAVFKAAAAGVHHGADILKFFAAFFAENRHFLYSLLKNSSSLSVN